MQPKKQLIRLVRLAADGSVIADRSGKASGRGAYICDGAECFAAARKRRALERNLGVADCGAVLAELETGRGRDV